MLNFSGSCDRLAYLPCSTAEIAGLNAAIPEPDDEAGAMAAVDAERLTRLRTEEPVMLTLHGATP